MSDFIYKCRHWSFHRQGLEKKGKNVQQVLRDVIAVYSAHPSAPLSLLARLPVFTQQEFFDLDKKRQAYRMPAMRLTIHLIPSDTAPTIFAATVPPASDPVWQKRYSQKNRYIPPENYQNWQKLILRITDKPRKSTEIRKSVHIPDASIKLVLNRMAFEGKLLRIGAPGLRSNMIQYVSTRSWTNNEFQDRDNKKSIIWLAGKYLKAFGPARVKDFQWWAGISAKQAEQAFSNLNTTGLGDSYFLLSEDINTFESYRTIKKDCISVLPRWDCYTMAYAADGRERFVSGDMLPKVYGKIGATGGNAVGVILVNGLVHGTWDFQFKGKRMTVMQNMFEKITVKLRNEIEAEFTQIGSFLHAGELEFI
jgi:hypothetical protein